MHPSEERDEHIYQLESVLVSTEVWIHCNTVDVFSGLRERSLDYRRRGWTRAEEDEEVPWADYSATRVQTADRLVNA